MENNGWPWTLNTGKNLGKKGLTLNVEKNKENLESDGWPWIWKIFNGQLRLKNSLFDLSCKGHKYRKLDINLHCLSLQATQVTTWLNNPLILQWNRRLEAFLRKKFSMNTEILSNNDGYPRICLKTHHAV